MAEEASAAPPVEAPAPTVPAEPTEPAVEHKTDETIEAPKEEAHVADLGPKSELSAPEGENAGDVAAPPAATADDEDAPASGSKKDKRKSTGGVPEHKSKKLNKKKSMLVLRMDCKPGEQYWARLKGYPPWPAIICDEQMLPESLLASRPVSTTRADGSLRDDFKEGGKNAKERTYPIMFLSTNEFTWMVNTNLTPLDPEECKTLPKSKMTKALTNAWQLASESHDLGYYKDILKLWQEEQAQFEKEIREQEEEEARRAEERAAQAEEDAKAAAAAGEADKKKKKKSRKSKGGDDDVDMEDADAPKSSKKRKKETESDAEKPKKTPKVTKLNVSKTPNGEASGKKSAAKSKKKVVQAPSDAEEDAKPQMSDAERLQQREKAVLYLRHRLQKGFLSRDQAPQENEMAGMAEFFSQLESYDNLEPSIIRATKIHKVLKAIVKLSSIPKDEEFQFKKRSSAMLEIWNKRMEADGDAGAPPKSAGLPEEATPQANGVKEASAAPAPAAAETTAEVSKAEVEEAAKEGAEKADEPAKVDETAEKLDEKVEEAVPEEQKGPPAPEASAEAAVAEPEKPVAPAVDGDAMDTAPDGEAPKEAAAATGTVADAA